MFEVGEDPVSRYHFKRVKISMSKVTPIGVPCRKNNKYGMRTKDNLGHDQDELLYECFTISVWPLSIASRNS